MARIFCFFLVLVSFFCSLLLVGCAEWAPDDMATETTTDMATDMATDTDTDTDTATDTATETTTDMATDMATDTDTDTATDTATDTDGGCQSDAHCAAGQVCEAGQCVLLDSCPDGTLGCECHANDTCSGGLSCNPNGICEMPCSAGENWCSCRSQGIECDSGWVCEPNENTCVPSGSFTFFGWDGKAQGQQGASTCELHNSSAQDIWGFVVRAVVSSSAVVTDAVVPNCEVAPWQPSTLEPMLLGRCWGDSEFATHRQCAANSQFFCRRGDSTWMQVPNPALNALPAECMVHSYL